MVIPSKPAETQEIEGLRRIVAAEGLAAAAKRVGLGRTTVVRVLAGMPVNSGTRSAVREALRAH